jgi:hypothetical protein
MLLALTFLTSLAQATQFEALTWGILQLRPDDNQCAIVKIHSLVKNSQDKLFHQEGMGWITFTHSRIGVLTPYHVVAEGAQVFAECNGEFYSLSPLKVNPELDLAYFEIASSQKPSQLLKQLFPVIVELGADGKSIRESYSPELQMLFSLVSPPVPPDDYQKNMTALSLSVSSYGIASAPEIKDRSSSLIVSPDFDSSAEAAVNTTDPLARFLVRVDGLGVRPGLSGSALFGVISNWRLTALDKTSDQNQWQKRYGVGIQIMPKVLLGMVSKTRLNGAEAVAISMADIFDFLQDLNQSAPNQGLFVRFQKHESDSGLTLIPSMVLESTSIFEHCGDSYKNTGNLSLLEDWTPSTKKIPFEKQKVDKILFEKFYERPRDPRFEKLKNSKPQALPTILNKGGDYGEGGDGFAPQDAQFIISKFNVFRAPDVKDGFEAIKRYQSRGLYKLRRECKYEGLALDDKVISEATPPGEVTQRLVTFEDLRVFYKAHGANSLELIKKYASYSSAWPYEKVPQFENSVLIPLLSVGKLYSSRPPLVIDQKTEFFNNKFVPASKRGDSPSWLQVSAKGFELQLYETESQLRFGRTSSGGSSDAGLWHGSLALSPSCNIELKPENFEVINSWKTSYKDENADLTLTFGAMNEFLRITINHVQKCSDLKALKLAQVIVYANAKMAAIIGTTRTAVLPQPMDFDFLKKNYIQLPEAPSEGRSQ